jgi:hypothetical protein
MKIEMYVLCLLRFQDGKIVFTEPELDKIKDAIAAGLQKQQPFAVFTGAKLNRKSRDGFEVYTLDSKEVETWVSEGVKIKSAEIGYYHHRVIAYLRLDSAGDFSKLRKVRDQLKQQVDKMIECSVKEQINKLICDGKVRAEAEVEFFYTYPLIVVKKRRKRSETFPFSEETSTLWCDIVEPSWFPPSGRRHMMRISIPGTILYPSSWGLGTDLRRDIVNVIYEYCLYEKKSMDKRPFKNALDENLLPNLWTQIVNRIGGRMIEAHTIRLNFLTILLIILSIISVIILIFTLILPYFADC